MRRPPAPHSSRHPGRSPAAVSQPAGERAGEGQVGTALGRSSLEGCQASCAPPDCSKLRPASAQGPAAQCQRLAPLWPRSLPPASAQTPPPSTAHAPPGPRTRRRAHRAARPTRAACTSQLLVVRRLPGRGLRGRAPDPRGARHQPQPHRGQDQKRRERPPALSKRCLASRAARANALARPRLPAVARHARAPHGARCRLTAACPPASPSARTLPSGRAPQLRPYQRGKSSVPAEYLADSDLAGPLVFCLVLGTVLLLKGKVRRGCPLPAARWAATAWRAARARPPAAPARRREAQPLRSC